MMIREGVAMHAFNGELFVQATGYQFVAAFPDTVPDGQPEAHQQPEQYRRQAGTAVPVQINDSGAALGYYVSEDGYPGWMPQKWTWIPRELPGGRASFIHVLNPWRTGRPAVQMFYSVMEQMKMLDTLQNTAAERHCEGDGMPPPLRVSWIRSQRWILFCANSQEQRKG